ncbi:hypothetical protein EJB05_55354, partial [Eragrostis curvula]
MDYSTMTASLRKIRLPYGEDVALSVQVVSFACGGFTVAWCTNHVLVDGSALTYLISAWSELARTGTLAVGSQPNHDRSFFRPRGMSSYGASLDKTFTLLHAQHQADDTTSDETFVERLYYIEAVVDDTAEDTHCRMSWRVNGRWKLKAPKPSSAAMRNYVGNVITLPVREASVQEVLRRPLPDVAEMVREAITAPSYDEHFQGLVDWVEDHKTNRFAESAMIVSRPGDDEGSWIISASIWPRLAEALESDKLCIFKPLTAKYLGLSSPQVGHCRL